MNKSFLLGLSISLLSLTVGFSQSDSAFKSSGKIIVQVIDRTIVNVTDGTYGMYINRAFLGYAYQFAPKWSGTLVIDAGSPTVFGNLEVKDTSGNVMETSYLYNEGSVYTSFIRLACLEYNPSRTIKIQAGGILQNHFITQEKFWGFRYVLQTFQDLYFKTSSTDLGIIAYFIPIEMVSIDAAVTNGDGIRFNRASWNNPKFAGGITLKPVNGLILRAFYDNYKGNVAPKTAVQQLFSLFAGYRFRDKFRIGAEYNYHKNHDQIQGQDLYGPSIYGSYILNKKIEFFARVDLLQSNTLTGNPDPWNYKKDGQLYMGGISYYPVRGVSLSLSYQGWNPQNGTEYDSNFALCLEYKL